jgi:hypothetical protein
MRTQKLAVRYRLDKWPGPDSHQSKGLIQIVIMVET